MGISTSTDSYCHSSVTSLTWITILSIAITLLDSIGNTEILLLTCDVLLTLNDDALGRYQLLEAHPECADDLFPLEPAC